MKKTIFLVLLMGIVAWVLNSKKLMLQNPQKLPTVTKKIATSSERTTASKILNYNCATKKICKQMRSCAEAKFYLHECKLKRLDGDKDGIPCESHKCTKEFR